jgi:hypothetical protein
MKGSMDGHQWVSTPFLSLIRPSNDKHAYCYILSFAKLEY